MQHILITGGNAGIGKATAIELAKKGARIILACRSNRKAKDAILEIKSLTKNQEIYSIQCDLANLNSVRTCSKIYKKKFNQLDVLINNAGVITDKLQYTKDGYELQFGVNHLGHFLLTMELIELLLKSNKGRVINVSSNAHFKGKIDFNSFKGKVNLSKSNGMAFYSQSKLANVLFTNELANRYPSLCCHSLTPGIVNTQIVQKNENKTLWKMAWRLFSPFMQSAKNGAKTSIYLANSKEPLKTSGLYFFKQKEIEPSKLTKDKKLTKELWRVSHNLINKN